MDITIWNIGQEVRNALLSNEKLAKKVNSNIRPLIVKEGTMFPFIVYEKNNAYYEYNKDTATGATIVMNIFVFTDKYEEMCEISDMIDDAMADYFTNTRARAQLIASTENWEEDVYFATITYQFEL